MRMSSYEPNLHTLQIIVCIFIASVSCSKFASQPCRVNLKPYNYNATTSSSIKQNKENVRTKPSFFEKILGLKPGQDATLQYNKWKELKANSHDIFSNLTLSAEMDPQTGDIQFVINGVEKPSRTFSPELCLASNRKGPKVSGGIHFMDQHFRGQGETVEVVFSQLDDDETLLFSSIPNLQIKWTENAVGKKEKAKVSFGFDQTRDSHKLKQYYAHKLRLLSSSSLSVIDTTQMNTLTRKLYATITKTWWAKQPLVAPSVTTSKPSQVSSPSLGTTAATATTKAMKTTKIKSNTTTSSSKSSSTNTAASSSSSSSSKSSTSATIHHHEPHGRMSFEPYFTRDDLELPTTSKSIGSGNNKLTGSTSSTSSSTHKSSSSSSCCSSSSTNNVNKDNNGLGFNLVGMKSVIDWFPCELRNYSIQLIHDIGHHRHPFIRKSMVSDSSEMISGSKSSNDGNRIKKSGSSITSSNSNSAPYQMLQLSIDSYDTNASLFTILAKPFVPVVNSMKNKVHSILESRRRRQQEQQLLQSQTLIINTDNSNNNNIKNNVSLLPTSNNNSNNTTSVVADSTSSLSEAVAVTQPAVITLLAHNQKKFKIAWGGGCQEQAHYTDLPLDRIVRRPSLNLSPPAVTTKEDSTSLSGSSGGSNNKSGGAIKSGSGVVTAVVVDDGISAISTPTTTIADDNGNSGSSSSWKPLSLSEWASNFISYKTDIGWLNSESQFIPGIFFDIAHSYHPVSSHYYYNQQHNSNSRINNDNDNDSIQSSIASKGKFSPLSWLKSSSSPERYTAATTNNAATTLSNHYNGNNNKAMGRFVLSAGGGISLRFKGVRVELAWPLMKHVYAIDTTALTHRLLHCRSNHTPSDTVTSSRSKRSGSSSVSESISEMSEKMTNIARSPYWNWTPTLYLGFDSGFN